MPCMYHRYERSINLKKKKQAAGGREEGQVRHVHNYQARSLQGLWTYGATVGRIVAHWILHKTKHCVGRRYDLYYCSSVTPDNVRRSIACCATHHKLPSRASTKALIQQMIVRIKSGHLDAAQNDTTQIVEAIGRQWSIERARLW
jgi:hypothetical protein